MAKSRKKKLYQLKTEIIKALGQPLRLEIVDILSEKEMCVEEIANAVKAERSNVSRHLSVLSNAGLLQSRREGLKAYYSLKIPCVLRFFGCVEEVLEEQLKERLKLLGKE